MVVNVLYKNDKDKHFQLLWMLRKHLVEVYNSTVNNKYSKYNYFDKNSQTSSLRSNFVGIMLPGILGTWIFIEFNILWRQQAIISTVSWVNLTCAMSFCDAVCVRTNCMISVDRRIVYILSLSKCNIK